MNNEVTLESILNPSPAKFLEDLAQKGAPITDFEEIEKEIEKAAAKVPAKPPSDNIYDDIMGGLLNTVSKKHAETRERLEKIIEEAKRVRELLHKQEELAHEAIKETFINLGYVHSYADLLDTDLKKLNEDLTKHAPKKPSAATG